MAAGRGRQAPQPAKGVAHQVRVHCLCKCRWWQGCEGEACRGSEGVRQSWEVVVCGSSGGVKEKGVCSGGGVVGAGKVVCMGWCGVWGQCGGAR